MRRSISSARASFWLGLAAIAATSAIAFGCGPATPEPVTAIAKPPKAPRPGPFGKLVLPDDARVVWIVYVETWTKADGTGAEKKGAMTLRDRSLASIRTLHPERGYVAAPTDPPLGASRQAEQSKLTRAHAIAYAPGFAAVEWDSHGFEDTESPKESAPIALAALHPIASGCDGVDALSLLMRDFPRPADTGLSAADFQRELLPVIGDLLGLLLSPITDPQSNAYPSDDAAKGAATDPTCEGFGPRSQAVATRLSMIDRWFYPLRHPEGAKVASLDGALASSLVDARRDAHWSVVPQLWAAGPAAAAALSTALRGSDADVRKAALVAAWGLGRDAADAYADVMAMLRDKDESLRAYARWALGTIGAPNAKAIPVLLDVLRAPSSSDDDVRFVESALQSMPDAGEAAQPLAEMAKGSVSDVPTQRAFHALTLLGERAAPALSTMVEMLRSADHGDLALPIVTGMGAKAKDAVVPVAKLLDDPTPRTRVRACMVLYTIGNASKVALPQLTDAVADPEEMVRVAALAALQQIGVDAAPSVDKVKVALKDKSPKVRAQAARALGAMGPKAASAVPAMTELLREPSSGVEIAAANGLGMLGAPAKGAVPALSKLLSDASTDDVRFAAAQAMIDIGAAAASEVPHIVEALSKSSSYHLGEVIESMFKLGKSAAPQLGKLLDDKRDFVRRAAVVALGKLGKDASSEVLKIAKLLDGDAGDYPYTAIEQIGTAAGAAVPKLIDVLEKKPYARYRCLQTLPKIGAAAVAPMTKLVGDKTLDSQLRNQTAQALLTIGPAAASATLTLLELSAETTSDWWLSNFALVGKDAVAPLITALKDKRPRIATRAASALGFVAPAGAADAIPALLAAMSRTEVHSYATQAIQRFTPSVYRPICQKILDDPKKAELHVAAKEMLGA